MFLTEYQCDEPKIHQLAKGLTNLNRSVLSKFVRPSAFSGTPVEEIKYKLEYNQKKNEELLIGQHATEYISAKEKHHLKDDRIEEFYKHVKTYFITCVEYLQKKLPLTDEVLVRARIAEVSKKAESNAKDLQFFLHKYPALIPIGCTEYQVMEEFAIFQCDDELKVEDNERIDEVWAKVGEMKDVSGDRPYLNLLKVMRGILVIPHSSAHCERVFSTVRKNRTDQRASLGDKTLESLLVLKSNPASAQEMAGKLSEKKLQDLKSCYNQSLHCPDKEKTE